MGWRILPGSRSASAVAPRRVVVGLVASSSSSADSSSWSSSSSSSDSSFRAAAATRAEEVRVTAGSRAHRLAVPRSWCRSSRRQHRRARLRRRRLRDRSRGRRRRGASLGARRKLAAYDKKTTTQVVVYVDRSLPRAPVLADFRDVRVQCLEGRQKHRTTASCSSCSSTTGRMRLELAAAVTKTLRRLAKEIIDTRGDATVVRRFRRRDRRGVDRSCTGARRGRASDRSAEMAACAWLPSALLVLAPAAQAAVEGPAAPRPLRDRPRGRRRRGAPVGSERTSRSSSGTPRTSARRRGPAAAATHARRSTRRPRSRRGASARRQRTRTRRLLRVRRRQEDAYRGRLRAGGRAADIRAASIVETTLSRGSARTTSRARYGGRGTIMRAARARPTRDGRDPRESGLFSATVPPPFLCWVPRSPPWPSASGRRLRDGAQRWNPRRHGDGLVALPLSMVTPSCSGRPAHRDRFAFLLLSMVPRALALHPEGTGSTAAASSDGRSRSRPLCPSVPSGSTCSPPSGVRASVPRIRDPAVPGRAARGRRAVRARSHGGAAFTANRLAGSSSSPP